MIGKNAPGVGFDFEVRTGLRVVFEIMQGSLCVIEGGGEWCQWFGIERDVEMNTPFGRGCGPGELGKVFKPSERVRVEDHLMQVSRFVELLNGGEGLFVLRVEGEGVGEVEFGNTKPGLGEGVE